MIKFGKSKLIDMFIQKTPIGFMMRYILRLSSDWQVDQVTMDTEAQRVDVYLSHSGKNLVCLEIGERGTLYDPRRSRSWRHLDWFRCKCFIHCRITRVDAGIKTIQIFWADASSRVTYFFERWAIDLLKATTKQTKTAKLLRCGFNQLNRIMHRSVERCLDRRSLKGIEHVSVDEKALKRNHMYATVVSDSARGVVIDVGEGRTKKGTIALLERIFAKIKEDVETITIDMLKAFIGVVKHALPKAILTHDRFHLIQYLNEAINRVRRWEVKPHPELKGTRYVLLKNEANRTQKQDEIFKVIQESNIQVGLARWLHEEFKGVFECPSFAEAKTYFELWLTSVQDATVTEVIKVAEMFERHFDGVCNALCHEQSNAKACNGKIQEIKTMGRGYRTFENFRVAILFFCAGLDLYPQHSG